MHVQCSSGDGDVGSWLFPKNWVGCAARFPKSLLYLWAKIDPLLMTKMAEKPHTLWGRIYMYQYYPRMSEGLPLPPGCCSVLLKYSRICEVKSKLISDATSNMPDTHAQR